MNRVCTLLNKGSKFYMRILLNVTAGTQANKTSTLGRKAHPCPLGDVIIQLSINLSFEYM